MFYIAHLCYYLNIFGRVAFSYWFAGALYICCMLISYVSHSMSTFWQSVACLFLLFWLPNSTACNLTPCEGVTLRRWEMGPIFHSHLAQKVRELRKPWTLKAQHAKINLFCPCLAGLTASAGIRPLGTWELAFLLPHHLGTECCFSSAPTLKKWRTRFTPLVLTPNRGPHLPEFPLLFSPHMPHFLSLLWYLTGFCRIKWWICFFLH